MNILILSAGSRNKVLQYFKKALEGEGRVYAADCSNLAPAIYEVDDQVLIPRIDAENYISEVISVIKEKQIDKVLSLLDPELSILSDHRKELEEAGAELILSDKKTIDTCFNKWDFFNYLKSQGVDTVTTYGDLASFKEAFERKEISFPVFIKPRGGSASIGITKVSDMDALEMFMNYDPNLIIQELCDGKEYGIDAYFDKSNELKDVFIKEKIKMRAGETDKSVSLHDEIILERVKELAKIFNFYGPIDMDIFRVGDRTMVSEVNPRFGGGYPHAYESGVDFMKRICTENQDGFTDYQDDIYMMKYNEVLIKRIR